MKIGIMTPAFPTLSLAEVLNFASEHGFQSLEVACWPAGEEKDRKYGGVVHIDVDGLSSAKIDEIKGKCSQAGVELSALGYYPNPLHEDKSHREKVINHLKKVIVAAGKLGVGVVGTLAGASAELKGNVWKDNIDFQIGEFLKVWPDIIKFAADNGVKIAFEHCPMLWKDTWPLGRNIFYSPAIIRRIFNELKDKNYGLMFDPSHLIWQRIDYIRFVYDFKDRIICVHAQDMDLDDEMCYEDGILGVGINIQRRRIPGMGRIDWQALIRALYNIGYDFVLNIEHEDSNWEGSVEKVGQGFLVAKKTLELYTY
jgi:sugar phosphate isomerase/epimerase